MIAIIAPYDRTEITWAAVRLADLVVSYGQEVQFVAVGKAENRIHPYWDTRRRTLESRPFFAEKKPTAVVHFMPSCQTLTDIRRAVDNSKQILVPVWHEMKFYNHITVRDYDVIVAPSRGAYSAVLDRFFYRDAVGARKVSWARFDYATTTPRRRDGLLKKDQCTICLVANAAVIDFWGPQVVQIIRDLLGENKNLVIHLLSSRTWPDNDRRFLYTIASNYPGRLLMTRLGGIESTVNVFQVSDWVAFPAVRHNFGMMALRAMICGCAVIAFNMAPLNEFLNASNSFLVDCSIQLDSYHAPRVVPNYLPFFERCSRAAKSEYDLKRIQQYNETHASHAQIFHTHWAQILGLEV